MPPEVADSDAESDSISPRRPTVSPLRDRDFDAHFLDPSEPDPILDLRFSQFLSPTQRLSSAVQQHDDVPQRSSGSTDRFLREVEQPQQDLSGRLISNSSDSTDCNKNAPTKSKTKRQLSDIENDDLVSRDGNRVQLSSVKRSRTSGNSRISRENSLVPIMGKDEVLSDLALEHQALDIAGDCPGADDNADSSELEQNKRSKDTSGGEYNRLSNAVRLGQDNARHSTVRRRVDNGYHGISLDFRNGAKCTDIGANPFGSASQSSLDGDIDTAEVKRFTDLFAGRGSTTKAGRLVDDQEASNALEVGHPANVIPAQSSTVARHRVDQEIELPSARPDGVDMPFQDAGTEDHTSVLGDVKPEEPNMPLTSMSRTRNRKSKIHKMVNQTEAKTEHETVAEDQALLGVEDSQDVDLQQGGGMEDNDQQSETGTQHKRKKRKTEITEDKKVEKVSPVKNVSSELELNDPNLIGMPKEIYHAKPSRSRSRKVTSADTVTQSAVKNEGTNQHLAEGVTVNLEETDHDNTTKQPRRKGRSKGAKSSAAKPSATKSEEEQLVEEDPDESQSEITVLVEGRVVDQNHDPSTDKPEVMSKQISVDIPRLSKKAKKSNSRTKKRGRTSKVETEADENSLVLDNALANEVDSRNEATSEAAEMSNRSPLADKDPNTVSTAPQPEKSSTEEINTSNAGANVQSADVDESETKTQKQTPSPAEAPIHKQSRSPQKPGLSTSSTPSSTSSNLLNQRSRIGLSKRMRIPSLLRKLDRTKEPPKIHERKEKLTKKQQEAEEKRKLEADDGEADSGVGMWSERGADGMLLEWDD